MSLLVKVPKRRIPARGARVNLGHPLARGLLLWVPGVRDNFRDATNRFEVSSTTTGVYDHFYAFTPHGEGLQVGSADGKQGEFAGGYGRLRVPMGTGRFPLGANDPWTMLFTTVSIGSDPGFAGVGGFSASYAVDDNVDYFDATYAGKSRYVFLGSVGIGFYGNGPYHEGNSSTKPKYDGRAHVYGISYDGTSLHYVMDGIIVQTVAKPSGMTTAVDGRFFDIGTTFVSSAGANMCFLSAAFWSRALSEAEVHAYGHSPQAQYALFEPSEPLVWAPFAGGGLPTLTSSTYKPGTLTTSGWTPRITAS